MKDFSEFAVKPLPANLDGDKISITRILNREIVVLDYIINPSKFPKDEHNKCMTLQFLLGTEKHIIFTSALGLIANIKEIPRSEFPFKAKIVRDGDRFIFTGCSTAAQAEESLLASKN